MTTCQGHPGNGQGLAPSSRPDPRVDFTGGQACGCRNQVAGPGEQVTRGWGMWASVSPGSTQGTPPVSGAPCERSCGGTHRVPRMVSPGLGLTTTARGTQHTASGQRGHTAAVLRPSDAVSCVFYSSPMGGNYIITENAKAEHCGSNSRLSVGPTGQECNEAPWEGALSHVTPACPQVAPTAGVSNVAPLSTAKPNHKGPGG